MFQVGEARALDSFVYLIKQKITRSYDDVDDFAASVAISKLQTD